MPVTKKQYKVQTKRTITKQNRKPFPIKQRKKKRRDKTRRDETLDGTSSFHITRHTAVPQSFYAAPSLGSQLFHPCRLTQACPSMDPPLPPTPVCSHHAQRPLYHQNIKTFFKARNININQKSTEGEITERALLLGPYTPAQLKKRSLRPSRHSARFFGTFFDIPYLNMQEPVS